MEQKVSSWTEIVKPDHLILEEQLRAEMFAADLYDVLQKRGSRDYYDPERFANRTYPTKGLVQLIADVVNRLLGKGGVNPVIQIQTPFGGGKTHALIALYHFAKSGEEIRYTPLGDEVAERVGVTKFPQARVAAFVGTVPDPLRSKTPWGVIAEQLGRYDLVKEHDKKRLSPGRETLEKVLGNEPTLILLDEIVEYAVRVPKEFQTQVMAFCQELTEAVRSLPRCCLVATLPSSVPYGEEGHRALRDLEQIFGRMQAVYEPVSGFEIYEVIRKRLFEFPNGWEREAAFIVDEYISTYRQWNDAPDWAQSEDFRERMMRSFPFHPLVIDWLYERWGSFPTFQRTRGVLRFLGLVVRDAWRRRDEEKVPLIQPNQVDLSNPEIEGELIRHIGDQFRSVIQADIRERAKRIDDRMETWGEYKVATGLANSIFLASFTAGERKGISAAELKIAVWRPGLEPAVIGDTLKNLERTLLYLHERDGLYLFDLQPTLTKLILDYEERVTNDEIRKELERRVKELVKEARHWKVLTGVQSPKDVPDTRELQMVLLPFWMKRSDAEKLAKEILTKRGETPRVYRNALVVVFANELKVRDAESQARTYLAMRRIGSSEDAKKLSAGDQERLKEELERYNATISQSLLVAYQYVVKLTDRGTQTEEIPMLGISGEKSLPELVTEFLKERDWLVDTQINPSVVKEMIGMEGEKRLDEIWESFGQFPEFPILLHKGVLAESVRKGTQEGLFAVRINGREYFGVTPPAGDYWVDSAILLKEPTEKPVEKVTVTTEAKISVEDIVRRVGTRKQSNAREIYQQLWKERQKDFPSEARFRQEFIEALGRGIKEGQLTTDTVTDHRKLEEALELGTLTVRVVTPPPPAPSEPKKRSHKVEIEVPTMQIGQLAMTLAHLNSMGLMGNSVRVSFSTAPLTDEKLQQLRRALDETAQQLGAKVNYE